MRIHSDFGGVTVAWRLFIRTTSWRWTPRRTARAAARRRQRARVSRQVRATPPPPALPSEATMARRSGYTSAVRSRKLMGVSGAWLAEQSTVPSIDITEQAVERRRAAAAATGGLELERGSHGVCAWLPIYSAAAAAG